MKNIRNQAHVIKGFVDSEKISTVDDLECGDIVIMDFTTGKRAGIFSEIDGVPVILESIEVMRGIDEINNHIEGGFIRKCREVD